MQRILQPELLDSLPPDHPDALHNRRDLLTINALMGNQRWFARRLPRLVRAGENALEIGAGTGELSARLARLGLSVAGLDICPKPAGWPAESVWHRTDLRTFLEYARYQVIFGNLIFHQFEEHELARLGAALRSSARLILACEPTRRPLSRRRFRTFAPLLGMNRVTLHDAEVSIAAGFIGDELPRALGLVGTGTARTPSPAGSIGSLESGSGSHVAAVVSTSASRCNGRGARVDVQNDTTKTSPVADRGKWDVTCSETVLGAYRMIAIRRE